MNKIKEFDKPPLKFINHISNPLISNLPPSQIYKPLHIVGKGAYGSVWKGCHLHTGFVVAIKVIDFDLSGNTSAIDDDVADIQREVSVLSRLRDVDNKNVTRYYGCHLEGSKLWIIMDYAGGGSVRTLMKAQPRLDERFVVVIVRECLYALSFLHKSGIIHRDIKAANILINSVGRVLLCDFGVSASLPSASSKRTTFIGTPYWMAPEVIAHGADAVNGREYDSKADIWSLGITIYEMCQGRPPLSDQEAMKAIFLITRSPPARLPDDGKYSREMRELVGSCLVSDPKSRPSADELLKCKYIKSSSRVPTSILRKLQTIYSEWEMRGGQRASLAGQVWDEEEEEAAFNANYQRMSGWDYSSISPSEAVNRQVENDVELDAPNKPIAPRNRLLRIFDDPNAEDENDIQLNTRGLGLAQHRKTLLHGDSDATMRQIDLNAVGSGSGNAGGGGGDGMIDLSAISAIDDSSSDYPGIDLPSGSSLPTQYDDYDDYPEYDDKMQSNGRTIRASYGAFQPAAQIDTSVSAIKNRKTPKTPTAHRHKSSYASSRNFSTDSTASSPNDFSPKVDEHSGSAGSGSGKGSANSSANGKNKNVFEGSFAFRAKGNNVANSAGNSATSSAANSTTTSPQSTWHKTAQAKVSPQMKEDTPATPTTLGSLSPSFQFPPIRKTQEQPPSLPSLPSLPNLSRSASLVRSHSHNPCSSTGSMWELEGDSGATKIDVGVAERTKMNSRPTVIRNSSVSVMETIPSPDMKASEVTKDVGSARSAAHATVSGQERAGVRGHGRRSSQASESMNPSSARYRNIGRRTSRSEGQVVLSTSMSSELATLSEDVSGRRTREGPRTVEKEYKPLDYNRLCQTQSKQMIQEEMITMLDEVQMHLDNMARL
ncbi:hypothetical protein E3P86_01013 [Wallemia ichthyophaga]|uniref:non-specific serine/threonine protein kinase n=1 Tax=Wallemia ichthyophaga TaxID=245174 RepID=A0A4T0JCX8_WALIC|nr:hypothetical protein E3P86_01013 [Wallemia ichthyophaga]